MESGRKERLEQAREFRELVSMKMSKAEVKKQNGVVASAPSSPRYPWGLSLNLDTPALEKLSLGKLPKVGDVLELEAKVKVTSVSENESGDGKSKSLGLQVTDLCLEPTTRRTARRKG